jgi:hypothetical protein
MRSTASQCRSADYPRFRLAASARRHGMAAPRTARHACARSSSAEPGGLKACCDTAIATARGIQDAARNARPSELHRLGHAAPTSFGCMPARNGSTSSTIALGSSAPRGTGPCAGGASRTSDSSKVQRVRLAAAICDIPKTGNRASARSARVRFMGASALRARVGRADRGASARAAPRGRRPRRASHARSAAGRGALVSRTGTG